MSHTENKHAQTRCVTLKTGAEATMSPAFLRETLTPFLQVVFDLQDLILTVQGKKLEQMQIRSIEKMSPVVVVLDGACQAIDALRGDILPKMLDDGRKASIPATGKNDKDETFCSEDWIEFLRSVAGQTVKEYAGCSGLPERDDLYTNKLLSILNRFSKLDCEVEFYDGSHPPLFS